jgi:hypothetical protein
VRWPPGARPRGRSPSKGGPLANTPGSSLKGDALPASPTAAERQGKADGYDPRDDYPASYGFTNPFADAGVVPGEFESVRELLIGWGAGAYGNEQFFADIIAAASTEAPVTIVVPDQQTANTLDYDLERVGADLGNVRYLLFSVDSIWMRDYGPLGVVTGTGARATVDPRYYWGRWMGRLLPDGARGRAGASR